VDTLPVAVEEAFKKRASFLNCLDCDPRAFALFLVEFDQVYRRSPLR